MRYWVLCSIVAVLGTVASAQNTASQPADANAPRVTTLVLQPAPIDASKKYTLLPPAAELKDGDAAAFYKKAIEAMPKNLNNSQLQEWMKLPLDKLPQDKVQALMQQAQASLQLVAQGAACKNCNWTREQSDLSASFPTVRQIAFLFRLRARLEIAQKRYEDTIATIRTALTMGKHIGEGPTVTQGMLGIAVAEMTLQRVEDLAQTPNAPNLLPALKALPQPLIDLEKVMAKESRGPADMQRERQIVQRLRSTVAGLQCIEALRHYAATHNNQLPAKLGDISDVQLPNDPATDKPFAYRLEGSKAVLELSAPKGGLARDSVRYEITVAR